MPESLNMKHLIICAAIIFCSYGVGFSQQRPLLTDDVDISPPGTFRIGIGVEFLQNAKFPLSGLKGDETRVGDFSVRIGLSPNVEFQIDGTLQNFIAINSAGTSAIPLTLNNNSTNDIGDFTISTKIKLKHESKGSPSIGFKFGVQLPNTNQARGVGTNQTNVFGKILVQKMFGKEKDRDPRANIYGNIGLAILPAPIEKFTQNDVILYGAAGIFRLTQNINLAGEINGRRSTRSGNAPLGTESLSELRIGTQIKASGLRFDTSAVIGLSKFSPRTGISFGVTYQSSKLFTPAR